MKVILLFSVQFAFWAILTVILFSWTAHAWFKKQHRLFGLSMTAALCTSAMLLNLIII